MSRTLRLLSVVLILACGLLASCHSPRLASSASSQRSLVIIHDNDVHCSIDGYARMAGLRDAIADTAWTQLVSSGDFIQGGYMGAISRGQYVIDVMKQMDYDAIALGNHEFDYGTPHLVSLMSDMGAPVTCSNFVDASTHRNVYPSYVMRKAGPYHIAYIGTIIPSTMQSEAIGFFDETGRPTYDLCPDSIYQLVQRAADDARSHGADYVIVLSHIGDAASLGFDSHSLVRSTRGIDAVLDGHTHNVVPMLTVNNLDGQPVVITQTGTQFSHIGKLIITPDGRITSQLIPTANISYTNARIQSVIDSVKAIADQKVKRILCHTDHDLRVRNDDGIVIGRVCETPAGNLVADAFRSVGGTDVSVLNAGSLRNDIFKGDVTYGDLISFVPYDNWLCVAEVTGRQLHAMLEANIVTLPRPDGQFPQVSGMRFVINISSHKVSDVSVLDRETGTYVPLDPDRTYTITATDYIFYNGGMRNTLRGANVTRKSFIHYCDALIDYVTNNLQGRIGSEYSAPQGRITLVME